MCIAEHNAANGSVLCVRGEAVMVLAACPTLASDNLETLVYISIYLTASPRAPCQLCLLPQETSGQHPPVHEGALHRQRRLLPPGSHSDTAGHPLDMADRATHSA